jgi:hypothetical protein
MAWRLRVPCPWTFPPQQGQVVSAACMGPMEYGNIRAQCVEPAFHMSLGGVLMKSGFSPFSPHLTLLRPLIQS